MNKKGLSPLASTVLLLVISIIIGIIVMSWGRSYVEKATANAEQKQVAQTQPSFLQDLDTRLRSGELTQTQYDSLKAAYITSQK